MKILVTGAKGFVGKNLCAQLRNIAEGKNRSYGELNIEAIYEYDIDYVAMPIGNEFIVGYGLDYNQIGRNLKDIYVLDED